MNIIAKLELPRQHYIEQYNVVLAKQDDGSYSTHLQYNGSKYISSIGAMTFDQAWEIFKTRAKRELNYSASVFEINQ